MALQRQTPYSQFNFTVDLSLGVDATLPLGGFQECSAFAQEVSVAEFRYGNDPLLRVQKITGLNKVTDVTLKRGASTVVRNVAASAVISSRVNGA